MADDLNFQQLSTVQSNQQLAPARIAAAATVAPTTFITFVSGTTPAIATITPPVTGAHMLIFIFTDAPATFVTTGNVANAIVPTEDLPTFLFYDPVTAKYHGCASNLT